MEGLATAVASDLVGAAKEAMVWEGTATVGAAEEAMAWDAVVMVAVVAEGAAVVMVEVRRAAMQAEAGTSASHLRSSRGMI